MIEEIQQVEQKLNKEGIKATSAVDQHELTPPKLMLGYFFMVSGWTNDWWTYFATNIILFKPEFNTSLNIRNKSTSGESFLKRDTQIVTYNNSSPSRILW